MRLEGFGRWRPDEADLALEVAGRESGVKEDEPVEVTLRSTGREVPAMIKRLQFDVGAIDRGRHARGICRSYPRQRRGLPQIPVTNADAAHQADRRWKGCLVEDPATLEFGSFESFRVVSP